MKKLIYLFILTFGLNALAQKNEQPPIIFEGVVVSATEFFIDSTGKPNTNTTDEHGLHSFYTTNTSYLVKVTRVLKGQELLDTGYVEVITKLSYNHINNQGRYENYISNLYPGIFFMEPNTIPVTLSRKTDNKIVLQPFHFKPMKIDFNRYDCFAVDYKKDRCYKTKNDLADYLKKEYNIDYLGGDNHIENNNINIEQSSTKKKSVFSNNGLVKNQDYQKNLDNYSIGIYDELCTPIITYFTPTVSTGIGDSITIKGKYFGNDRFNNNGIDTAQIRFRNADKTNLLYMSRLDNMDYLYWSDTKIRVVATSMITTEDLAGIGTGKFIVKNKWGDTIKSNSNLYVEYAIRNYGQPYSDVYLKKRANLIYDTTGYV